MIRTAQSPPALTPAGVDAICVAPMWGLVGAKLAGAGTDSTELARRHAVWIFPAVVLLHGIFVRGLAPDLQQLNLVAAALALVGGLAFRWLQRATVVILIMFAFGVFTFVYMFGVAAPLTYLVVSGRRDWIPATALTTSVTLGVFLFTRVRASWRNDWSKPLEEAPGVQIATADWILWRGSGRETPVLNIFAMAIGLAFIPAVALTRDSPQSLMIMMFVGPICIALLLADAVARQLAFYFAVRRWETEHGTVLRFPKLSRRRVRRRTRGRGKRHRR